MGTVYHIQIVRSRLSSNKLKNSKFYVDLCLLMVRSSCSRLAFFLSFLAIAKCAVLLLSLVIVADICCSLCLDPTSDLAAVNNDSVGTGGAPRLPLSYSVDAYICR